jgi:hypothetical protein
MVPTAAPIAFRKYQARDYDSVASLWTRINRELAPAGMEEMFERYIVTIVDGELRQLLDVFSEAKRSAFWVVESDTEIIGSFGIESRSGNEKELRRPVSHPDLWLARMKRASAAPISSGLSS